jgi:hypothetical protein
MTTQELKEQLQNDILTILEGWGIDEALEGAEYNRLVNALCENVIFRIDELNVDGHK